jgi:SAM-dependent methyltransferase
VPGLAHENYWFRRHEAAYAALGPLCAGSRVLDAGCGEGYGAAAARQAGATTVIALDYDRWAVEHAARTYRLPAVQGNLVDLPVADDAFDLVLSLQTLEHVWNQPRFLAECARVLRPGGRLALTTPNRLTFPPGNPFHAREVDVRELRALAESSRFHVESLLGLRHGDRITAYEREHGDVVSAQLGSDLDRWPDRLGAFVASVIAQDFVFSSGDLDTSLDLLLVAARRAADESAGARRLLSTLAGTPPATARSGISSRTTACAASTQPCPTTVPRRMLTRTPTQQSGPMRTGDFTIPWSLIGLSRSSNRWSKSVMYTQSAKSVRAPISTSM